MWTLALDVFGTAPNTVLNTFQVGKMNTGAISLGEAMTYKVLYENTRLRVFSTQQVYTYDYKCVQDTNATMLVYGWKLIDYEIPDRGRAKLLLAPTGLGYLAKFESWYTYDLNLNQFFTYDPALSASAAVTILVCAAVMTAVYLVIGYHYFHVDDMA